MSIGGLFKRFHLTDASTDVTSPAAPLTQSAQPLASAKIATATEVDRELKSPDVASSFEPAHVVETQPLNNLPVTDSRYDVVVCGAGPAGISAVHEALRAGAQRVLLIEKRHENTRGQTLTLEPAVISLLAGHTPDRAVPEFITDLRVYHRVDIIDGRALATDETINNKPLESVVSDKGSRSAFKMMFGRGTPIAVAPIALSQDVQLGALANDSRVQILNAEVIDIEESPNGSVVHFLLPNETEPHSTVATLTGVAVGAKSPLLEKLGVGRKEHVLPQTVAAVIETPTTNMNLIRVRGEDLNLSPDLPGDRQHLVRAVSIGDSRATTTFGIELPHGAQYSEEQAKQYLHEAARSMGFEGAIRTELVFSPTLGRAVTVFPKKDVALFGDASQTTAAWVGLGANLAILQGKAFGELYKGVRSRRAVRRSVARMRYSMKIRSGRRGLEVAGKLFLKYYFSTNTSVDAKRRDEAVRSSSEPVEIAIQEKP